MDLMELTQLASYTAGFAALVFIAAYALLARFWESQEGLNVMLLAVIIFLAVLVRVIGLGGSVDVSRILGIMVWFGVAGVLFWRTALLMRAQGVHRMLNRRLWRPRKKRDRVQN